MYDIQTGQFILRVSKPCISGIENVISVAAGENKFYSPLLIVRAAPQETKPTWKSAGLIWRTFNINSTLVKVLEEKRNLEIGDNLILFSKIKPYSLRIVLHTWMPIVVVTVWEYLPDKDAE